MPDSQVHQGTRNRFALRPLLPTNCSVLTAMCRFSPGYRCALPASALPFPAIAENFPARRATRTTKDGLWTGFRPPSRHRSRAIWHLKPCFLRHDSLFSGANFPVLCRPNCARTATNRPETGAFELVSARNGSLERAGNGLDQGITGKNWRRSANPFALRRAPISQTR